MTSPRSIDRPDIHETYGIERGAEGLLGWEWAASRLEASRNYWVATTRPDGSPHVMPVWGVFADGRVCFGTAPESVKATNLGADPRVVVHVESGDEAVVVEGRAVPVDDTTLLQEIRAGFIHKYGVDVVGDGDGHFLAVEPIVAFAWLESDYPATATRFRF